MTSSDRERKLVEVGLNRLLELSEDSASVEVDARVLFRVSGFGGFSVDILTFKKPSTSKYLSQFSNFDKLLK